MTNKARNPVKALITTNEVIEALDELDGGRVTDIAAHIDRPQSVVHNHLTTLQQLEYVVKSGTEYELGLRFLAFGERVRHRLELSEIARPEIERLADRTGELITLLVEEHGRGVYLDIGQGSGDIQYPAIPGNRIHLHCSAVGKAILAQLPDETVDEILDRHGLPPQSSQTITEREELYRELETVRKKGLAFDMEEFRDGLRSVGAPITRRDGSVIGAVSIAGPAHRMKETRLKQELPEVLRQSVNVIELNMNEPDVR